VSDTWDFYIAQLNGKVASIFVDLGIREAAPDASSPWLLWAWVNFNSPREDGLYNPEEADALSQIEDSLSEAVGDSVGGTLVGRITSDGRREFYFYGPTFAGFEDTVTRAMKPFSQYGWESGYNHDPDWNEYLDVLYPSPSAWQTIKNCHVIERLQEHGDSLEKERPVFHWAYFANESARDQFVAAVKHRGYAVTNQAVLDDSDCRNRWQVRFERIDHVDWDSMNRVTIELLNLADSLAGDYDGWETSVETDA
jgi:hypothetical protein